METYVVIASSRIDDIPVFLGSEEDARMIIDQIASTEPKARWDHPNCLAAVIAMDRNKNDKVHGMGRMMTIRLAKFSNGLVIEADVVADFIDDEEEEDGE